MKGWKVFTKARTTCPASLFHIYVLRALIAVGATSVTAPWALRSRKRWWPAGASHFIVPVSLQIFKTPKSASCEWLVKPRTLKMGYFIIIIFQISWKTSTVFIWLLDVQSNIKSGTTETAHRVKVLAAKPGDRSQMPEAPRVGELTPEICPLTFRVSVWHTHSNVHTQRDTRTHTDTCTHIK